MATKKSAATGGFNLGLPAKKQAKAIAPAKGAVETVTYRGKVSLAGFADGATTAKQAAKAAEKVAATLRALADGGAKLESPVGRNVAIVTTTDAKLAKKFELVPVKATAAKKAPAAPKRAVPAPAPAAAPAPAPKAEAAVKKAAAKKAPAKKAAVKKVEATKPAAETAAPVAESKTEQA